MVDAIRLRIDLAYDGTDFSGFADQPGRRTVQGVLEEALRTVLRLSGRPAVTCAGRTDAGVHARGQVCHVDIPFSVEGSGVDDRTGSIEHLGRRLNGVLPEDVRVHAAAAAPAGFDARFAAIWRRYAYRVSDSLPSADPLRRQEVLAYPRPLDAAAMNQAAAFLLGEHDFAAFCRRRPGASTIRHLLELTWCREPTGLLVGRVVADAFCHSMVRALVGALIAVGEGRKPVEWPRDVLVKGIRDSAVMVVRPHGLTLEEVGYPPDADLAARVLEARRPRRPRGTEADLPRGSGEPL